MQSTFTVNGSLIPQDPQANDMCLLFLKYGRCRFKHKCKKSHWIPPIPKEPYPDEIKPPLPNDGLLEENRNQELSNNLTCLDNFGSKSDTATQTLIETYSKESVQCSFPFTKDHDCCSMNTTFSSIEHKNATQDKNGLTNIITSKVCDLPCKTNMKRKLDKLTDTLIVLSKKRKHLVLPRRFKHIFQDRSDEVMEYSGIEILFRDATAYYDRLTQKVNVEKRPENKVEKHRLKILRRLHWKYTQTLKEKLACFPQSYFLKFDRSKINFTRLRPYIYILIHECLCSDRAHKPVKPSSFDVLIADTLIAYLDTKCASAQEAEEKLRRWGARAVRARQCIEHLWHVMAISSNSSEGCAREIMNIEQEVSKGSRTALDFAHACSLAFRKTKYKSKNANDNHARRKISSSVKQGLQATKRNVSAAEQNENVDKCHGLLPGRQINSENRQQTNNTKEKSIASSSNRTLKKRQRSKQFKNVSLHERGELKRRCVNLLSTLTC